MTLEDKSTLAEIETRFDARVEDFSDLSKGQATAVDGAYAIELLGTVAAKLRPSPRSLADLGCGAGNLTLGVLAKLQTPPERIVLCDLSQPMLDRAEGRLRESGFTGEIWLRKEDLRTVEMGSEHDLILASASLHHLRGEEEWKSCLKRLHDRLVIGGGLFVFDLLEYSLPIVREVLWARYGEFLTELKDEAFRDHVFAYIAKEDTPASLADQIVWAKEVGYGGFDVLHMKTSFAAWCAVRTATLTD